MSFDGDEYYRKKVSETDAQLDRIEIARKSIKHPRLYYVQYDMNTGEIKYVRKPISGWFSSKKVVKIIPVKRRK